MLVFSDVTADGPISMTYSDAGGVACFVGQTRDGTYAACAVYTDPASGSFRRSAVLVPDAKSESDAAVKAAPMLIDWLRSQ